MEASEPRRHRRSPILATLANLFLPPLGHIYTGQAWRGICLVIGFGVISTAALYCATQPVGVAGLLVSALFPAFGILVVIADAALIARRQRSEFRLKRYNRWYVYLVAFVLFQGISTIFFSVLEAAVVTAYSVYGTAMEPTLLASDRVMADNWTLRTRSPRRGEIVAFRPPHRPETPFIKRIVALPGETIEIRHSQVYIDGKVLHEPYLQRAWRDDRPEERVPAGHLFVMGDNRDNSSDSRSWGTVPRDHVSGVVRTVYFSWDRATSRIRWECIGRSLPPQAVIPNQSR